MGESCSERSLRILVLVDRVRIPAERSAIRVANLHPLAGNRWRVHHQPWLWLTKSRRHFDRDLDRTRRELHRTRSPFFKPWHWGMSKTLHVPIRVSRPTFQSGACPDPEPETSPHTEPGHPPESKPEAPPGLKTEGPPEVRDSEGPRFSHQLREFCWGIARPAAFAPLHLR